MTHSLKKIYRGDERFSQQLLKIDDVPGQLFYKGDISLLDAPCIAIVGSRKMTSYSKEWVFEVARDLSRAGLIVVSGMALGVDAQAHRGALEGSGKTIAVFASSLEDQVVGPRQNYKLSKEVLESGGLWLSEYEKNQPAYKASFKERNRIVAGISLGVVVPECTPRSGTMITARLGFEQSKPVFALPGRIDYTLSHGPHELIKRGAYLIENAQDILAHLQETVDFIPQSRSIGNEIDAAHDSDSPIVAALADMPRTVNELAKITQLPISEIVTQLTHLELAGIIQDIGNKNYRLKI